MSSIASDSKNLKAKIFSPKIITLAVLLGLGYALVTRPPIEQLEAQQLGIRVNTWTASALTVRGPASVWVWPGLQRLQRYSLTDRDYHPFAEDEKHSEAPLQSIEGLPMQLELSLRYGLDPQRLSSAEALPADLHRDLVKPLVHRQLRRIVSRYTLAEVFAGKRRQLQDEIEAELFPELAKHGVIARSLALGEASLLHGDRVYSLQDRIYRPDRSTKALSEAPFQSLEGLSIGVELSIRYALDPNKLAETAPRLPDDLDRERVEPLVQGVIYKVLTRYTVREIFSSKRQELQESIETELGPLMKKDGLLLRSVMMGNVDLPADYRAGMDRLLAVELQNEQMQYTLQLKEKQVKEAELQAEAEKVRREKQAEASAREQVIAAKAQEEAMRHVLPFKQKQVEQRKLEAEADRASRVKTAEGVAEARRIEAAGEADSRLKLADAEVYRLEQIGKVSSAQLERDGALIERYPLLIQKTLADKLSDKVSVIIAPPPADGGFIGNTLLGANAPRRAGEGK